MEPLVVVDLGPGVRAGFTTTDGGNLSPDVGGEPWRVPVRRAALAERLGSPVRWVRQVHGAVVHTVTRPDRAPAELPEADAQVTCEPGVALAVLVADCLPVLLADADAGVVAAVHAGRRGMVAGVVGAAVARMTELGAAPARLRAVVGPGVCGRCYEVPAALQAEVVAAVPRSAATTSWGTPALDLRAGVGAQLRLAGVDDVEHLDACTLGDGRWFSHRAVTGGAVTRGAGTAHRPRPAGARPPGRFAGVVGLAPLRVARGGPSPLD